MGVTIGGDAAKSDKITHLLDNALEAIAENRSARLDESDSTQKRKRLENTYEKYARLLGNAFNATYAVYLLRAQKYQPPGGVHISSCC